MTTDAVESLAYLRKLAEAGVGFYVGLPSGGMIDLAPEDIEFFLADRDSYWARYYKVSKEHFQEWYAWRNQPEGAQCENTNRRNARCRNRVEAPAFPYEYDPAAPVLCQYHLKNPTKD